MLRAVELLAKMHDSQRKAAPKVQMLDAPAVLRSPRIAFVTGITTRSSVENALGVAFSYPARGWHTYAVRESGARCFLSAFYKEQLLLGVELYVPAASHAPKLEAVDLGGFTLDPLGIRIGMDASRALEARFEGGAVYVKAAGNAVDRIAIYAGA